MFTVLKRLWQKETVLCISAVCAALTMLLVPPDTAYLGYIDLHVLILLFALMAVVAGMKSCGMFTWLTNSVLGRKIGGRKLGILLAWLPFFSAMAVTNDVALLVFVPFTIALLEQINCRRQIVPMLVIQTMAANLGSMTTPVGNPQNLYLYSAYHLSVAEFFGAALPPALIGLLLTSAAAAFILPPTLPPFKLTPIKEHHPRRLAAYCLLFALCLLSVLRLLSDCILLPIILLTILALDKKLLREPDYALLATFVCFFVISGNLARLDSVHNFLQILLANNTLLTAAFTSQFISNVPSAVLLSGFTDNWHDLLLGVDIGGLGTPVASLASLITLKLYMKSKNAETLRFLAIFTAANIIALSILLPIATIL